MNTLDGNKEQIKAYTSFKYAKAVITAYVLK